MVRVSVTDVDLIVEEAKTNSLGYWEQNKESKYPRAEWIPEDIKGERERDRRETGGGEVKEAEKIQWHQRGWKRDFKGALP